MGVGHSNLDRIARVRPDVVKVDRGLMTGIDSDFFKQEALNCLSSLCRKIGALVVAEGVETRARRSSRWSSAQTCSRVLLRARYVRRGAQRDNGTVGDIELLAQAFKRQWSARSRSQGTAGS